MNNFQTILVAIFLAFFVFAVLIFSGAINLDRPSQITELQGKIKIWGSIPNSNFAPIVDYLTSQNKDLIINYTYKDPSSYQQDLIESMAVGKGPDMFIISSDMIQKNLDFIYKIPYESYSQRFFADSFIDGSSIYMGNDGVIGFPLVIDPIVMYYNKDILSNEGIVNSPTTWDELFKLNSILTQRDNSGSIYQSMIALGQYNNVKNAKDILSTLLLQNNNNIISNTDSGYIATLKDYNSSNSSSTATVLKFFIEFSNPSNTAYSWNGSLPNSFDMFTSGKLAFYIGRASELFNIENTNPNLSFDVTQIPQVKYTNAKRTYGDIYAIVVNKNSSNISLAFKVASELSSGDAAQGLSVSTSLPPASKGLLANKPTDPYLSTFFNSALITKSWADPSDLKSDSIFSELLDNILSNKLSIEEAINKAQGQLELLNKKSI